MENPPSYDDVCRTERESRPQQVTLTLVLPSPSEEETPHNNDGTQAKDEHTAMEPPPYVAPSEPPPKYTEMLEDPKQTEPELMTDQTARENSKFGADMIFTLAFIIAFIFNWVGFIFAFCLSMSLAGRHGAIAGFGASMVKWSIIAMNSECCSDYAKNAACLLIALILCGFMIFVRGIYLHIKYKAQLRENRGEDGSFVIVYNRM